MFDIAMKRTFAATLVSSTLFMGGNALAFQVPASGTLDNADVEIGNCSGFAQHYEYRAGTGIGNAFAQITTPLHLGTM